MIDNNVFNNLPHLHKASLRKCYVNHDSNNWHFCANLSSGVLLVQNGDLACIGDMQKPSSPATSSWLWPRVWSSSYQPLRHWWSHASGKQASVDTCCVTIARYFFHSSSYIFLLYHVQLAIWAPSTVFLLSHLIFVIPEFSIQFQNILFGIFHCITNPSITFTHLLFS